jgi:branched-subunit amino acid ABC-type transport system permease component
MVGALVIGLASELAAIVSPSLKDVVAFGVLVLVLLVRPNGFRARFAVRQPAGVAAR